MNLRLPAQLIKQLQNGQLQSEHLTRECCDALKAHKNLNALCYPTFNEAIDLAKQRDKQLAITNKPGPLHGLPITIKECFALTGTPATFGVKARQNNIAKSNDIYVQALLDAGAVITGKSNVSQLLSFIETDNAVYGVTKHPKFPAYSCGGSSGGEGALVGAGLSPLGLGNDIGGSIRVPAAVNGACGIKPTGERFPDQCLIFPEQEHFPIKSAAGPISQGALTLHYALSAMQQKIQHRWETQSLGDYRNVDVSALKIGYFTDDGIFPVSQPCKEAVLKSVVQLKEKGAQVIEYRFPSLIEAEALFYGGMSIDKGRLLLNSLGSEKPVRNLVDLCKAAPLPTLLKKIIASILRVTGQRHESRILNLIGRYRSQDIPRLEASIADYKTKVLSSMKQTAIGELDAVISPVLPVPAYLLNSFRKMGLAGTYCLVNNLTGFPAGVACVGTVSQVPPTKEFNRRDAAERLAALCTENAAGLPLSVQITAKPWQEDHVLALIDALHQPFSQRIV